MTTHASHAGRLAALLLALLFAPAASAQLVADFTVDATAGTNPLTVQFTDTTTGGAVFAWNWDFGDGNVSSEQNPSHTYTLPGTHTVRLLAVGSGFVTDQEVKADLITVTALPLAADFALSTSQGTNPLTVSFTDQTTGTPPTGWSWDFGDGGKSTAQHPIHVYDTPGTYDVTLTASLGQQTDVALQVGAVTVEPTALTPAFTADVTGGDSPLLVTFTDMTTAGAPITGRLWDFGDGTTGNGTSPTHTYLVEDETSFDVSLTVFVGGQSETITLVDAVSVDPGLFEASVEVADYGDDNVNLLGVADLDGDERQDLLLYVLPDGQASGRFAYAPNPGPDPAFGAPVTIGPAFPGEVFGAWTGDVDGDGDLDVLYAFSPGTGVGWIEHLDGAGTFSATGALLIDGPAPQELVQADVDGDGDLDLVIDQGIVRWYEHLDGAGTYGPGVLIDDSLAVTDLDAADEDGDGDLDLVMSVAGLPLPRGVFWFENLDGAGDFGPPVPVHAHLSGAYWVDGVDLDDDGDADVVARYIDYDLLVSAYQVYEQVGGAYVLTRTLESFVNSVDEFVLDVDGDGDLDLIETRRASEELGGIWWAENRGGASLLAPWQRLSVESLLNWPAFGDVDDDGDTDFVFHKATLAGETLRWSANRLGSVTWPFLGDGLQGASGMPLLQGEGALVGDELVTLTLENGLPGATSTLVAGLSQLAAPFKGGVLVPHPDLLVATGPLDAEGELELAAVWPTGIPAGVPLWFQWWLADASGPAGFTASNAVTSVTVD